MNRLSVEDIEALLSNEIYPAPIYHIALRQLLDTMRENERLKTLLTLYDPNRHWHDEDAELLPNKDTEHG